MKKRKIDAGEVEKIKTEPQSDGKGTNTRVVEYKEKPDVSSLSVFSSGDEWSFEGLCEQLSLDLFAPKWETRHGAAIGLREVIKVHGSGYGRVVGGSKAENELRNQKCLEDLAIRLLCVLCLDRFADFVGDQAVIPVRETCAQTLAAVMQKASPELCLKVVNKGFLVLLSHHAESKADASLTWSIRHAALIGLKYWMAVRQDLLDRVLVPINSHDSPAFVAIVDGYSVY